MDTRNLAAEIIANYERHGWTLRRILLCPESRPQFSEETFAGATLIDSDFDALWFARASPGPREAWELRLLSENSYALFEAFEADESEEDRAEARLEMENKMREHAGPRVKPSQS